MRGMLKQQVLDKRLIDIGALVNEVTALVRSDTVVRHIKLEVAVAENLPYVSGETTAEAVTSTSPAFSMMRSKAARIFFWRFWKSPSA
jgi:hypothetical protein